MDQLLALLQEFKAAGGNVGPAIRAEEVADLEKRIGLPLSSHARRILAITTYLEFPDEQGYNDRIDFVEDPSVYPPWIPHFHPVMSDGFGNAWGADVNASTGEWGPILYVCHDPPVIWLQSRSFLDFIADFVGHCLGRTTNYCRITEWMAIFIKLGEGGIRKVDSRGVREGVLRKGISCPVNFESLLPGSGFCVVGEGHEDLQITRIGTGSKFEVKA